MTEWLRLAQKYHLDELLILRLQMLAAEERTRSRR